MFVYDPEVPVMAPGGPQALSGPFDQAALEMGNNLLVYTSAPAASAIGDLRAAADQAVCGDFRGARGFYGEAGARDASGRAEFLCIGIARSSWLFRDAGYAADEIHRMGVHAGADCVRARAGRAAAAGDRELGISAVRSQSFDGRRSAGCGQLELGAVDAAGAAHRGASFGAVSAGEGRAGMVTTPACVTVPEIALQGVSKRYRNAAVALEGISLTVERGEFVTFLGPSGCGKSTLLKLVSGLSPASEGTVQVNGMTPENAREMMSFIFQDATLLPWRTVEQNVGLGWNWSMRRGRCARSAWRRCWNWWG